MLTRTASQWRGWSDREYACTVYDLNASTTLPEQPSLLLAIRRDSHGAGQIVDITLSVSAGSDWPARARSSGASELHVYVLHRNDDPTAILDDLQSDPKPRAAKRRAA